MKFLVDNQLPPALARYLSGDLGQNAVHVTDIGMRGDPDAAIWAYAGQNDFVLISKDEDFVTLYSKKPSASLLWVRIRNCRRTHLLKVFEQQWPKILERFKAGERFVEIR